MYGRLKRLILIASLILLGIGAPRPYVTDQPYSATAVYIVETRNDVAQIEWTTVAVFERVLPSVVQVADTPSSGDSDSDEDSGKSGTGLVWVGASHVVTNYHVGSAIASHDCRQSVSVKGRCDVKKRSDQKILAVALA